MLKPNFDSFLNRQLTRAEVSDDVFTAIKEPLLEEMRLIRERIGQLKYDPEKKVEAYNIMIFGPTGSGKSSFIKTLFNAFQDHGRNAEEISPELIVKGSLENEGTTKFTCLKLKEGFQSMMQVGLHTFKQGVLGVHLYDTRGQIKMNLAEEAELDIMLEVL